MSVITDRILEQLGDPELLNKLIALSKSDLNSLLLELYQRQSFTITPSDLLKTYQSNRFSVPAEIDAIKYHSLECELLSEAQQKNIENILLSPSATFGSCSTFGCVDQNNVISSARGTETLSDPSNMLAIFVANKIKNNTKCNISPLHYCTTARVVRAQPVSGKGYYSHFGIFSMVSSGKDVGSYICEKELIIKQLDFYKRLFFEKYNLKLSAVLRKRRGYNDSEGFFTRITELIKSELSDVPISFDLDHKDNNYYKGINFKLYVEKDSELLEVGDGGFVDWIQSMTGNKKERCLISGIGIDRLLLL